MADDKQTVVETTEEKLVASTEGSEDARTTEPTLDELLAEFSQSTDKPAKSSTPEQKPTNADDLVKRLTALEEERAQTQLRKELDPVIRKVKGDTPMKEEWIEDILNGSASRNPKLANAWMNRHQNPAAWDKVVTAIGKDIAGVFSNAVDKQATEDREAVTAAVRGASTKAPEERPPEYGSMSNNEFADDVAKRYGFRPV